MAQLAYKQYKIISLQVRHTLEILLLYLKIRAPQGKKKSVSKVFRIIFSCLYRCQMYKLQIMNHDRCIFSFIIREVWLLKSFKEIFYREIYLNFSVKYYDRGCKNILHWSWKLIYYENSLWIMKINASSKFGLLVYTSFPIEAHGQYWYYQSVTISM